MKNVENWINESLGMQKKIIRNLYFIGIYRIAGERYLSIFQSRMYLYGSCMLVYSQVAETNISKVFSQVDKKNLILKMDRYIQLEKLRDIKIGL